MHIPHWNVLVPWRRNLLWKSRGHDLDAGRASLAREGPRFHLHFTPTHASWLNQVERWFGLLTQRQLRRGAHTSVGALKQAITDFIAVNNEAPKPFTWTKSADDILAKIARFAHRTLTAHSAP